MKFAAMLTEYRLHRDDVIRVHNLRMSQRSSAITLPSFGSAPGLTSSTLPPSFVTARRLAAIS
jgi:hypothetical protein